MHAAPDRRTGIRVGQRGAVALLASLAAGLAGCSAATNDNPALQAPPTSAASVAQSSTGPVVTVSGAVPEVAGHPDAASAFSRVAIGCTPTVQRDDPSVVSVFWDCPSHRVAAATYSLASGHMLSLGDVLTGAYQQYLSYVAAAQFSAAGRPAAATTDLSTWYVTPDALVVVFPAGLVSYPLASLSQFLRSPSPL